MTWESQKISLPQKSLSKLVMFSVLNSPVYYFCLWAMMGIYSVEKSKRFFVMQLAILFRCTRLSQMKHPWTFVKASNWLKVRYCSRSPLLVSFLELCNFCSWHGEHFIFIFNFPLKLLQRIVSFVQYHGELLFIRHNLWSLCCRLHTHAICHGIIWRDLHHHCIHH